MRKLATAAISFSAAVLLTHYLVPASWLVYCCAVFAAVSFTGLFFKENARLRIFIVCFSLAAGFIWCFIFSAVFYRPAEKLNGNTETVSAVVCGVPDETEYGSKVLVSIRLSGAPAVKTQLYIYGSIPALKPGNTIKFTASFRMADTIYGEKTETFISRGIYLLASIRGDLKITDTAEPVSFFPTRLAHALERMIDKIFPKASTALMRALILGDTAGIYKDPALSSALRTTGTSHIVAVSGMNIAFLMGFLGLFIKKKRILTAVGIPLILLFMSVVGFMPPVVRAGVMQIFLLIAPVFKRENDPLTSLSAALMLILLLNPFAAGSAGLHLSFAAILGIMLFTERIYTSLEQPLRARKFYDNAIIGKSLRIVIGSFATTVGALVFTVPLTALHFGTVSLITPLTNLFILWAVTIAFCGGIVAVVVGFIFTPAGTVLAWTVGLPATYVLKTIETFSHVPFASVYTSNPAIVIWLVYIYFLFIAILALRIRLRQLLYPVCFSAVSLCLILFLTSLFSNSRQLSVTALDVGQGQSVVVSSGKCTALIDCGSSSGKNAGDIAVQYLLSQGRTSVDLLILTHYHSDHVSGISEILERVHVSAIALPTPSADDGTSLEEILGQAAKKGIAVIYVTENQSISFDNAVITLISPLDNEGENERGLSILCSENDFDALITGDMNAESECKLINTTQLPDIELLVVGHHGSKLSTSDALLETIKPETAIISVGYNTYGHPSEVTLKKLSNNGIMVYRTDTDGTVTINGW